MEPIRPKSPSPPQRICFFGTYEREYIRNWTLREGLRRSGWDIQECHVPIWEKTINKTGRYLGPLSLIFRTIELMLAYILLIVKYFFCLRKYDVMIVGYIGHLDMPLAWLLTRFPRRPLVFSPLISLYDTLVHDRASFSDRSVMSQFLRWMDRWTCARADLVLLDTFAHIDYFVETFKLPRNRFERVLVGAREMVEDSATSGERVGDHRGAVPGSDEVEPIDPKAFRVIYTGKFTPLHGLTYMLKAAYLLRNEPDIEFYFVGTGQLVDEIHETARRLALENVQFKDWAPYEKLAGLIAESMVCLGIFGETDKAHRVIPAKVFAALSYGKAVITANTPGSRELLKDGENAILCDAGDAESLASAILRAKNDPELLRIVEEGGKRTFSEYASVDRIGEDATKAISRQFKERFRRVMVFHT